MRSTPTKVGTAEADLVIGCDPIVAANKATLAAMRAGRTYVALNTHGSPTAAFVTNPDWQFPAGNCEAAIGAAVGDAALLGEVDADELAIRLVGDSLYTNPLLLGYAWQKGRVPVSRAALLRAIELNGVQVDNNKAAFEWGRRAAHDLAAVQGLVRPAGQVIEFVKKSVNLDDMVAKRVEFLTAYQNAAYCGRVQGVRREGARRRGAAEQQEAQRSSRPLPLQADGLQGRVRGRALHTETGFLEKIATQFEGDYTVNYHLAPPLIAKRNDKGELGQAEVRPVDEVGLRGAGEAEGPARHRVRHLRPHRGAPDRACA
jgi:indolepyruvate ferredoxin oxidoreductase